MTIGLVLQGCILVEDSTHGCRRPPVPVWESSSGSGAGFEDEMSPEPPLGETAGDETASEETGCAIGSPGCACTEGGACDPGAVCVSDLCVRPSEGCAIGAEGCPCTMGGACDPGLECLSRRCVAPE